MFFPSVVCQKQIVEAVSKQLAASRTPTPVTPASDTNATHEKSSGLPKHQPHKLEKKVFLAPGWCDNCHGILVGSGFQCTCCHAKCHLGLGKGSENCHADILMKPCHGTSGYLNPTADKKKRYEFGDVTRQLARNAHQAVKDTVVKEAIKEQQAFGKFDLLREQVLEMERRWKTGFFIKWFIGGQIALLGSIWAISYGSVALLAGQHAWDPSVARLGNAQAACAVRSLLLLEMLVLFIVRYAAGQALMHSELIFTFFKEILHIDMAELANIKIEEAAKAVQRAADRSLVLLSVLFVLTLALGLQALKKLATEQP